MDCCILNIYKDMTFLYSQHNFLGLFHNFGLIYYFVSIHGLTPVEKISSLSIQHQLTCISTTIDNSNNVPIRLSIIDHQSLEVWIGNTIIGHHLVQIPPHYTLTFHVFILHITYRNHHDLIVERIIHMADECHPTLNKLYMIKHDPSGLEVPPRLHQFD